MHAPPHESIPQSLVELMSCGMRGVLALSFFLALSLFDSLLPFFGPVLDPFCLSLQMNGKATKAFIPSAVVFY